METINIITDKDLLAFKQDIINGIKEVLKENKTEERQYLKSSEVKSLLNISENTLKQLRIQKKLTRILVGRSYFYARSEVLGLFSERTENAK